MSRIDKYSEFLVTRTGRLQCKRVGDVHADEFGMREYSFMMCPHGCGKEISAPTYSLVCNKATAIRDHLLTCKSFTGERPAKRWKTKHERAPPPSNTTTPTPTVKAHASNTQDRQSEEIKELKQQMADMEEKHAQTNAAVAHQNTLLTQHQARIDIDIEMKIRMEKREAQVVELEQQIEMQQKEHDREFEEYEEEVDKQFREYGDRLNKIRHRYCDLLERQHKQYLLLREELHSLQKAVKRRVSM